MRNRVVLNNLHNCLARGTITMNYNPAPAWTNSDQGSFNAELRFNMVMQTHFCIMRPKIIKAQRRGPFESILKRCSFSNCLLNSLPTFQPDILRKVEKFFLSIFGSCYVTSHAKSLVLNVLCFAKLTCHAWAWFNWPG